MFKTMLATSAILSAMTLGLTGPVFAENPAGVRVNSPIGPLPQANPGQCFARIVIPAEYEKVPETVVVQEGYETQQAVEPEFAASSVEVMTKEAGVEYRVRQPVYETRTEQVVVKPGFERLQIVPAQYETVTEEIQIGERRYVWKPGANLSDVKRIDSRTGQVYCLVEIPPKTTTVTRKVLVAPERVERLTIEPEYTSITKEVLVDRGGVEEIPVPAQFTTVATQELIAPARTDVTQHAAETRIIERAVLRAPERYEWVEVLCETNATTSNISAVQQALADRGYYTARVDGIMGPQTQSALEAFQNDNGIPHSGNISIETLRALGLASHAPTAVPAPAPQEMSSTQPVHAVGPKVEVMEHSQPVAPRVDYGAPRVSTPAPVMPVQPVDENGFEIVSETVEGQIEYVDPAQVEDAINEAVSEPQEVERPSEYSVRRRLDWDGK